jgi:predicted lipoprotein
MMRPFFRLTPWLLFASLIGLTSMTQGCKLTSDKPAPSKQPPAPPVALDEQGRHALSVFTVKTVTLPTLQHWQAQTRQFAISAQQQCQAGKPDIASLQTRLAKLYPAWYRAMLYDFGPLRDNLFFPRIHFVDSMRQRGKNYHDTIAETFDQALQGDRPLNKAYFDGLKFTQVGLPAIEVLLHDPVYSQTLHQTTRACDLLIGLSGQQQTLADTVLAMWQKGTPDTPAYLTKLTQNQLADGETATGKLLFSLQDYLRYLNQRQLNGHLDAQLSNLTRANLIAGLNEVEKLLTASHAKASFIAYLQKAGHDDLAQRLLTTLQQARTTTQTLNVAKMRPHYYQLLQLLERPLPEALDVNLGMNFTDGD